MGRRLGWFNRYFPEQSNELYGAEGTTDDAAYGQLGVASFTIELGDTQFRASCDNFENTIFPDTCRPRRRARVRAHRTCCPRSRANGLTVSPQVPAPRRCARRHVDITRYNQANGRRPGDRRAQAYLGTTPWQAEPLEIAFQPAMAHRLGIEAAQRARYNGRAWGAPGPMRRARLGGAQGRSARPSSNRRSGEHGSIVGSVIRRRRSASRDTVRANAVVMSPRCERRFLQRLVPHYTLSVSAPQYEPCSGRNRASSGQNVSRESRCTAGHAAGRNPGTARADGPSR